MRLSNDRDQALIRSAVSDAGANMLTFVPTLGTGEVFAFGAGVPLPTRMKFRELPVALRPTSEAGGNTRVAGAAPDRDLIDSVIDRWRASTMSHKAGLDDDSDSGWSDDIPRGREEAPGYRTSPPLQPAAAIPPAPAPMPAAAMPAPPYAPPHAPPHAPAAPVPAAEPRPSILRKPLTGAPGPNNPAPLPSRFRT